MVKKAVIVGVAGQDGRYLRRLLENKGYEITGLSRNETRRGNESHPPVDITDATQVASLIASVQPDEVYYLAAVHQSSEEHWAGGDGELFRSSIAVNLSGVVNFLDALKIRAPQGRFFYAASSHVFGLPDKPVQDERSPLNPVCVYGITKTAGLQACRYYASNHGLFASVGILYNHESPARRQQFISRRIVETAKAIKRGATQQLVLGDLDVRVDWGYAPDFTDAMHRILNADAPDTFVVATGELYSIRDLVEATFGLLGLDWQKYVVVDPTRLTKKQKGLLRGDSGKLRAATGWKPSVDFGGMVRKLVFEEAP